MFPPGVVVLPVGAVTLPAGDVAFPVGAVALPAGAGLLPVPLTLTLSCQIPPCIHAGLPFSSWTLEILPVNL
jgi:hypothetical protein